MCIRNNCVLTSFRFWVATYKKWINFMRKCFNNIVFMFLTIYSCFLSAAGSSGLRNITNVAIEGSSFIHIRAATAWDNPDTCGNSDIAIIPASDLTYQAKLSMALSAYMGGKKVIFWFVNCQQTPWGYTAPVVYSMNVGD